MSPSSTPTAAEQGAAPDPWLHGLEIRGVRTAPDRPLENFFHVIWSIVGRHLPEDPSVPTVLHLRCDAAFCNHRLQGRDARVTGIDSDPRYPAHTRFGASLPRARLVVQHPAPEMHLRAHPADAGTAEGAPP